MKLVVRVATLLFMIYTKAVHYIIHPLYVINTLFFMLVVTSEQVRVGTMTFFKLGNEQLIAYAAISMCLMFLRNLFEVMDMAFPGDKL